VTRRSYFPPRTTCSPEGSVRKHGASFGRGGAIGFASAMRPPSSRFGKATDAEQSQQQTKDG
ncbi:hypothetical protein, partial [Paraburkholderia sediminicola]|uniref:hypothetical protein n=1 Tax=Paraburkholderia sediminicola TaxID=458836 RepID=UPI0038B6F525